VIATVCDSNVYISAIVFGGIPHDVQLIPLFTVAGHEADYPTFHESSKTPG